MLSADVINFNISTSATTKGETLLDTLRNIEAMHSDMFVVRHAQSGAAHFIARNASHAGQRDQCRDGRHAHPTQAMLDMFTIRKHKGDFTPLRVAIVGDARLHSKGARSQILALNTWVSSMRYASSVRAPAADRGPRPLACTCSTTLPKSIRDVDVVIVLRLQNERMDGALLPNEQLPPLRTDRRTPGSADRTRS